MGRVKIGKGTMPAAVLPSFNGPRSVPGLIGWYRADKITGKVDNDAITQWNDDSGQGNHLVATTNGPTYKVGVQNGMPAVRFDGVDDNLQLADTSKFRGTSGFSLFIVGKFTYVSQDPVIATSVSVASTTGHRVYMHTTNGIRNMRAGGAGDASLLLLISSDFGTEGAAMDVSSYTFTAGVGQAMRRNQTQLGNTSDADVHDAGAGKWSLMTTSDVSSLTAGDISEVVYYEPAIDPTDRDNVEGYLRQHWNI